MAEVRKIAAILAADVVGYSRLAGADEDRTPARLRALRSDLIDSTIAVHHRRVVTVRVRWRADVAGSDKARPRTRCSSRIQIEPSANSAALTAPIGFCRFALR